MKTLLMIFILFSSIVLTANENKCSLLFSPLSIENMLHDLAELRLRLDLAQTSNDTSLVFEVLEKKYKEKENKLRLYLEKNKIMTYPELVKKITKQISLIQNRDNLEEIAKKNQIDELERISMVQKGFFGTIKSWYGYSFELLSTHTTQIIWQRVATLINDKHGGVSPSRNAAPIKIPIPYLPGLELLPMHTVSFTDVQTWFKGLNELSRSGTPELSEIFDGHEDGDSYFLPTKIELDALRDAARLDSYRLENIAWTAENSKGRLHEVKQKDSILINGKPFFDLLGNVREWINEKPQHSFNGMKTVWGLAYNSLKDNSRRTPNPEYEEKSSIGFRIVRRRE